MLGDLAKEYVEACKLVEERGEKLAKALAEVIKEVVPDIEWSLGWAEAGADTICFYSDSRCAMSISLKELGKYEPLSSVVKEVFPELVCHVDDPFGVYLTKEEAEKLRKLLREVK